MTADQLFTDIDAPDSDDDELAFTPAQYATLERLTKLIALLDVNAARIEQVTKWRHTDESDANEPIWWHAKKGGERIDAAIEQLRLGGKDGLAIARKQLVKGLALGLAAIDRIDAVLAATTKEGSI